VVRIDVPPLRERPEDIPLLAALFAEEISKRLGRPVLEMTPSTVARLRAYSWPGNVRELKSVVERALVLDPVHGLDGAGMLPAASDSAAPFAPESDLNLREAVNRLERDLLVEAQRRADGVRKEAARLLGVDPRNLSYYLRKHGLTDTEGGS
jgi:DNA-binding NtrC family response regulator